MIAYLLDVSLCWMIFYLLYYVWLSKETFFHLNRWYLLGTLFLGLIIPLLPSPFTQVQESEWVTLYVAPINMSLESLQVTVTASGGAESQFDWLTILKWIYWTGLCLSGVRFLSGLWQIGRMYWGAEHIRVGQYRVALTNERHLPFSFFHVVFKSKLGNLDEFADQKITDHELAHVRGWHTIDVLLVELVSILLWCSPPVHLYRHSLRIVHEYIADSAAIRTGQKKKYGHLLIRQSQSGLQLALANNFIQSQLKKRIMMMTKRPSRRQAFLKYLPVIPLLVVALVVFSNWEAVASDPTNILGNNPSELTDRAQSEVAGDYDPRILRKKLSAILHKRQQVESNQDARIALNFAKVHDEWARTYPEHEEEIHKIAEEVAKEYELAVRFSDKIISEAYFKKPFKRAEVGGTHTIKGADDQEIKLTTPNGEQPYVLLNDKPAPADWKKQLNPDEIESVEVLKGEAAIDAYGEKAKDGAIRIYTKDFKKKAETATPEEEVKAVPEAKVIISKLSNAQKDPLFIVDGVALVKGSVNDLDPDEIESIEVLKGASAIEAYGERGANGVVRIFTKQRAYDVSPVFPGCEDLEGEEQIKCSQKSFLENVYRNIRYPASARNAHIEGMVVVKYTIDTDGKVKNALIHRGLDEALDREVLRVIKDLPDWKPAKKDGKAVPVDMIIPVRFKIENDTELSEEAKKALREDRFKENKKAIKEKSVIDGEVGEEVVVIGYGQTRPPREGLLIVEEMPRFPGCESESAEYRMACAQQKMLEFVYSNIAYPKEAQKAGTSGTVLASFIVGKDGKIRDVQIERGRGHGLNEQVLAAIDKMPDWIPGRQDGKAVDAIVHLPVKFKLDVADKKPTTVRVNGPEQQPTDQLLDLQNFKASPNPNNGWINLRFQTEAQPLQLRIFSSNGQVVYERNLPQFIGSFDEQIDLQDAPKGTLFITVQQGEKVHTSTIILQ